MPTHQGKSQTDIVIGYSGASAAISLSVTAVAGAVHVAADAEAFTVTLLDAAGAPLSVVSGALAVGTSGSSPIRRSDSGGWTPAADSRSPTDGPVEASRAWRTDWRSRGRVVASVTADLLLGSEDAAGVARTLTVLTQSAQALSLELTFDGGEGDVASARVDLTCVAVGDRSLSVDAPTVDDELP